MEDDRKARIQESFERSGEIAAAEIYRSMTRLAAARHVDREASEEACQEALTTLWAQREKVRDPEAFAIAVFWRRVCDWRRGARCRQLREGGTDPELIEDRSVDTSRSDIWLRQGLARLDRGSANLLWFKYAEGRTDAEIGDRSGLSPASVPKLLGRAAAKCRKALGRR